MLNKVKTTGKKSFVVVSETVYGTCCFVGVTVLRNVAFNLEVFTDFVNIVENTKERIKDRFEEIEAD